MSATAVDLSLLEAMTSALRVTLLRNQTVREAGVGPAYSGFAAAARLEVSVAVYAVNGDASPTLTVVLEGSSDEGDSWAEVHAPWVFGTNGTELATVDSPRDWLRVRWDVGGGLRDGFIAEVAVVPASIEQPGGGAGEVVSRVEINGAIQSLQYPAGTTVLLLDTRAKPWVANKVYATSGVDSQTELASVAYPTDGDGSVWLSAIASGGTTGAVEPAWAGDSLIENDILWSAASYDAGGWQALKDAGDYAGSILANGHVWNQQEGTTSGSEEPDWASAGVHEDVTDGDIVWRNSGPVGAWVAHTHFGYVIGTDNQVGFTFVLPTTPAGVIWAAQAGHGVLRATGAEEPDWDTASGHFTLDGDIVWRAGNDTDQFKVSINGIAAPAGSTGRLTLCNERGNESFIYDQRSPDGSEMTPDEGEGLTIVSGETDAVTPQYDSYDFGRGGCVELVYIDGGWLPFAGAGSGPD